MKKYNKIVFKLHNHAFVTMNEQNESHCDQVKVMCLGEKNGTKLTAACGFKS